MIDSKSAIIVEDLVYQLCNIKRVETNSTMKVWVGASGYGELVKKSLLFTTILGLTDSLNPLS